MRRAIPQNLDLLSSLIACGEGGVEPQTLRQFWLKDLSIDERVRTWCSVCCPSHWGLTVWFFYFSFQLYILLSPNLCFFFFLYLDLYLLGDDTLIRDFLCEPNIYLSWSALEIRQNWCNQKCLSPPGCFTDRFKAVLLLGILYNFCVQCLTCSWLSCVWCFLVFLSLFHLVSWVRSVF